MFTCRSARPFAGLRCDLPDAENACSLDYEGDVTRFSSARRKR